jgi:hypothetical protein
MQHQEVSHSNQLKPDYKWFSDDEKAALREMGETLGSSLRDVAVKLGEEPTKSCLIDVEPTTAHGLLSEEYLFLSKFLPNPLIDRFIIFSDSQSQQNFLTSLRSLAREGFVSIGGGTATFNKIEKYLNDGTPLFIIDRTGGSSTIAADMVRTMNEALMSKNMTAITAFNPEENFVSGRAKIRIQNWPDTYRKDSVLVIDPFKITPSNLLDNMTRIVSSSSELSLEIGAAESELTRLKSALAIADQLEYNATLQEIRANTFFAVMVILALLTTASATMHVFFNLKNLTDTYTKAHHIIGILNIVLPVLTTLPLSSPWIVD